MTPLSDHDLQSILSGNAPVPDSLGPADESDLDAYRAVWAALETPPPPFALGFADRVAAAVDAERQQQTTPSRSLALPLVGALAAIGLLVFRAPLAAALTELAPVDAIPWVAAAILLLVGGDLVDLVVRRRVRARG